MCTGNTCRSPMAACILESLLPKNLRRKVKIESAGVRSIEGAPASENAIQVCSRRGIDISGHRSRTLTKELIDSADLILVMEKAHLREVGRLSPGRAEHALLLTELDQGAAGGSRDISDPCGGSADVYERCFTQLESGLEKGMRFLIELIRSKERAR